MINLGIRAHDLGRQTLESLSAQLASHGIHHIQLAINKALTDLSYQPGKMSSTVAEQIRIALAQKDIQISVLGCYVNLIHPDTATRKLELEKFFEHLRFAGNFGSSVVGTETGHRSPDGTPDPETQSQEAFKDLVTSVESLVKAAEQSDAVVGIEPVADKHPLSTIDRTARLLQLIPSPKLKIIFDPVNLIPSKGILDQGDFLRSAFQAFGPAIAVLHTKDYTIRKGQKDDTIPLGSGELDVPTLMNLVISNSPDITVLIENFRSENLHASLSYLKRLSRQ